MTEQSFSINSFSGGINEYLTEALMNPNQATNANNCTIDDGSLKTFRELNVFKNLTGVAHSTIPCYYNTYNDIVVGVGTSLIASNGATIKPISGAKLDYVNFAVGSDKLVIMTSIEDLTFSMLPNALNSGIKVLKNRRISYNKDGVKDGYFDANGNKHTTEDTITTLAPYGSFMELHYDRLWISGNKSNPDRLYFSTAGVNGADIEDWTTPIEEAEANQHGGFIDVRSYDGSKIIGMKVIFNSIVVFKETSAYKIFGSHPSNYELVQLFSSNGAIADKSICVGNNGAFFLNSDGIYFYDGTNTTLISQAINKLIGKMNIDYASKSVGAYYNNKYYLSIPISGSTSNNILIEYNTETKSFMYYSAYDIHSMLLYEKNLLLGIGSTIKIFNKREGIGKSMIWESPRFDFGAKNTRKNSNYIYFRGSGNGSVKFTLISDKKTKEIIVPLDSEERIYKKKFKNKGRWFKLKIENVENSIINISSVDIITEVDED